MPPARIWPSAPMFQNFIIKAGAMATAAPSRGTAIFTVSRRPVWVPREPRIMSAYTIMGLWPSRSIIRAPSSRASTMAAARMAQAFPRAISVRLAMRTRGSRWSAAFTWAAIRPQPPFPTGS